MFGLGKKKTPEDFWVYQTEIEKYRQLIAEIKELIENGEKVVLVYFFQDTGTELRRLLQASDINYSHNEIVIGSGYDLSVWGDKELGNGAALNNEKILVAEVYPRRSRQKDLMKSLEGAGSVTFFTALDSPFFEAFGGDRLGVFIKQLGFKDNEKISHAMVSKSVIRAQEQFEKKVKNEEPAESIEQWIKVNYE